MTSTDLNVGHAALLADLAVDLDDSHPTKAEFAARVATLGAIARDKGFQWRAPVEAVSGTDPVDAGPVLDLPAEPLP